MKKKKQRQPKRNKGHKKVSVDKTRQPLRSSRPEFESFLDEMIGWFSDHQEQVDERFSPSDTDGGGSVNLKDFECGLTDLDVPCQQFQLHMLTQLLKTADNMISYQNLSRQVQRLRDDSELDTQISDFMKRRGAADEEEQRAQHQLRLLNPEKNKFIRLSVRLVPFDSAAAHPGNFEVVLVNSIKVFSLIRVIQERVGIQTWRFSRAERPQRRSTCPQRAPWRNVALKEGRRKLLQRPLCSTTTDCLLQTVPSSTVTTTSGQSQILLNDMTVSVSSYGTISSVTAN
ncbi:hypothetical protein PAMP_008805 [Pampus punctatissimus]